MFFIKNKIRQNIPGNISEKSQATLYHRNKILVNVDNKCLIYQYFCFILGFVERILQPETVSLRGFFFAVDVLYEVQG